MASSSIQNTIPPSSPSSNLLAIQPVQWIKMLNRDHYYSPCHGWNLVPCCKPCANQTEQHNIVDLLSMNPKKHDLVKSLILKLYIGL
jgi:hypothetical protein